MKLLPPLIAFIIIAVGLIAEAQEVFTPASRSQSLGGISVCLDDSYAVFGNQAGMSKTARTTIGGSFQNRFLIKELSTSSGFFILPVKSSIFALSLCQFGKATFRQEKYGLSYAKSLSKRLTFGLQFNYYRFFLSEENQNIGSYGMELGFQYQLTSMVLLGIHTINPYKTGFKTFSGEYDYPSIVSMGAKIDVSDSFCFLTELEKYFSYPLNIKTGIEYNILNKLYLRTGLLVKPNQLTAGIGYELKKIKFDLAVSYNAHLGNSPSASFQYQF